MEYAISSQNSRNIVSESLVILVADGTVFNLVGSVIPNVSLESVCTASCRWLSHYATSRKVAGSIPDEVIGFLN
jgi:hypothetical protein